MILTLKSTIQHVCGSVKVSQVNEELRAKLKDNKNRSW